MVIENVKCLLLSEKDLTKRGYYKAAVTREFYEAHLVIFQYDNGKTVVVKNRFGKQGEIK
jgi:hypothetical protein